MEALSKKTFYSTKNIAFLFLILSIVSFAFINYRAANPEYIKLAFLAGFLAIVTYILSLVLKLKVDKNILTAVFLYSPFFIYGLFITPASYNAAHHINTYYIVISFYIASLSIVGLLFFNTKNIRAVSSFLLVTWLLVSLYFLIISFFGNYNFPKKDFSGSFHDRNVYSITTILLIVFFLSLQDKVSLLGKIAVTILLSLVVYSKSVTGFLGVLLISFQVYRSISFRPIIKVVFFIFTISFIAIIVLTENQLMYRIDRFIQALSGGLDELPKNSSAYIRVFLLSVGYDLTLSNPFFGIGLDNARFLYTWPLEDTGSFLHNTYLDISTSGGFPLLVFYLTPLVYSMILLIKNRKKCLHLYKLRPLWNLSFYLLLYQFIYSLTWTAYFEFGMIFFSVFAVVVSIYLDRKVRIENSIHRQHSSKKRSH